MTRPLLVALTSSSSSPSPPPRTPPPRAAPATGAKLLAAGGSVRVVSVKEKPQNSETRRERIYGCWTSTGRRFTLFQARDFGLDSIERDHYEIVDGRYIGAIRHFEGGVSESLTAATYDAQKHIAVHDTKPCNEVSSGDHYGVNDAVFFNGGGIAYTCWKQSRIVDAKGDRELEPAGTHVPSSPSRRTRTTSASASTTRSTTRP